jgi:sugar lactone lactonase YvrE
MTVAKSAAPLTVVPVPGNGAEDVVVAEDGSVYTGTEEGFVYRITGDGRRIDLVGATGGRPLGLELLPDGRLLVCDSRRGLLVLDPDTGDLEVLVSEVAGQRMVFCNNATVARSGDVYFSDSSRFHGIDDWKRDLVENTRSGRLLRRAQDGTVEVLLEGLAFANGVALAPDESFVAVAETGARTLVRLWLTGPRRGTRDLLARDLPGYPDNVATGSDGLVWVTVASPRDPVLEWLMRAPMALRRAVLGLPAALQPKPKRTVRVMALDPDGLVVHDHTLDATSFHMVTGVREHGGRVWLGSLVEPAVAVFELAGPDD